MRVVLAVVAALALAAPAAAGTWTFGRRGGNIRPVAVKIDSAGHVTAIGATVTKKQLSRATLSRLLRTAQTNGFFAMPAFVACPRVLPDVASLYVTYRSRATAYAVTVHGGCRPQFATLYNALSQAAIGS